MDKKLITINDIKVGSCLKQTFGTNHNPTIYYKCYSNIIRKNELIEYSNKSRFFISLSKRDINPLFFVYFLNNPNNFIEKLDVSEYRDINNKFMFFQNSFNNILKKLFDKLTEYGEQNIFKHHTILDYTDFLLNYSIIKYYEYINQKQIYISFFALFPTKIKETNIIVLKTNDFKNNTYHFQVECKFNDISMLCSDIVKTEKQNCNTFFIKNEKFYYYIKLIFAFLNNSQFSNKEFKESMNHFHNNFLINFKQNKE